MPAPTNQTAATALDMSLNYTLTLPDVDLATPNNCDVWWKYTAQNGDKMIGFFAYDIGSVATYNPTTTAWTGPDPGTLSPLLNGGVASNVPIQVQVTAGQTYYFRVRNNSGSPPAAGTSVYVSAVRGSDLTAPAGSILVNDDTIGFPAVLLSEDDGSALQFILDFPAGEEGDTNEDGSLLIYDSDDNNIKLFTVTAGVVDAPTTVALDVEAIRLNPTTQAWWTATQSNPATVRRVASDGSIGATIWALTHNSVFGLAVNPDETIAYYSQRTSGSAIHTFDLGPSTPGSDLVAGVGAAFVRDILIPADGNIIASYVLIGSGEVTVRRYSPAGATLNTYGPYSTDIPSGTQPRLAYWGATAFGLWIHDGGTSFFHKIDIATGAILLTVESDEYEGGIYQGTPIADPGRFGNSFSCPFIITTTSITGSESPEPPEPPEPGVGSGREFIPRRLRRAPHLSNLEVRTRFHRLQVDLQAGVGLVTGQGSDPQLMMRHSNDGGRTWSNEQWASAGAIGEYRTRVNFRRLGQARDRVFEVVVSDPVAWQLAAAYLDAGPGES